MNQTYILQSFILIRIPSGSYYHHPHFTGKNPETQSKYITQGHPAQSWHLIPGSLGPEPVPLTSSVPQPPPVRLSCLLSSACWVPSYHKSWAHLFYWRGNFCPNCLLDCVFIFSGLCYNVTTPFKRHTSATPLPQHHPPDLLKLCSCVHLPPVFHTEVETPVK
jgi:hypothetical protein